VPYQDVPYTAPVFPDRVHHPDYRREAIPREMYVPDVMGSVLGSGGT
jgi:hypothetical protein